MIEIVFRIFIITQLPLNGDQVSIDVELTAIFQGFLVELFCRRQVVIDGMADGSDAFKCGRIARQLFERFEIVVNGFLPIAAVMFIMT